MLEGYKTYIGGIGFILMGVGGILAQIYEGKPVDLEKGLGLIITGWSIIGIRSGIKKV
jgi:hypothetical protein